MILGIYPEAAYQFSHVWSGLSRHKKGETKIIVDHWGHGTIQASVTVTGRNWNYYDWVQGPGLVNRSWEGLNLTLREMLEKTKL